MENKLNKIKDIIASSKGYPDWETMENFIIDNNSSVVTEFNLG
jgi:hypothetical protein